MDREALEYVVALAEQLKEEKAKVEELMKEKEKWRIYNNEKELLLMEGYFKTEGQKARGRSIRDIIEPILKYEEVLEYEEAILEGKLYIRVMDKITMKVRVIELIKGE